MSDHSGNLMCDGPQDCGSFFLDAVGPFSPAQVLVQWKDQPRPSVPAVEEFIEKFWTRRMEQASAEGTKLWDGPLCRLIQYQCSCTGLSMSLGPTSYRAFVGTNLHNAHLRYLHGPEVLANPLGVSAVVIAEGAYLIFGKRSETVAYHAGRIHPIGGCVEPDEGHGPDPFSTMGAELEEELGLGANELGEMTCLGLIRDKHIVQPELIFDCPVQASVERIRSLSAASKADEHTEIIVVRDHPASVVTFLESNLGQLTPVAMASLLLHGLNRWGSGWFASTRGYLRSLI